MFKIIAAAALLATTAPAIAQPDATTRIVHVSYADLDLRRTADVKILNGRLRTAVSTVCPEQDDAPSVAIQRCRKTASIGLADQRAAAIAKAASATQLAGNMIAH